MPKLPVPYTSHQPASTMTVPNMRRSFGWADCFGIGRGTGRPWRVQGCSGRDLHADTEFLRPASRGLAPKSRPCDIEPV
jgi:hypothetical protein